MASYVQYHLNDLTQIRHFKYRKQPTGITFFGESISFRVADMLPSLTGKAVLRGDQRHTSTIQTNGKM